MKDKRAENSKTMMVISMGFIIIYLVWDVEWAIYVALAISVLGTLSDYVSDKVSWLWMKLAWLLGLIIPKVLLALVFYLILFPTSIISRLFGKRSNIELKNGRQSLFIEADKDFEPGSFEKPW
jgi:hypothetical protein